MFQAILVTVLFSQISTAPPLEAIPERRISIQLKRPTILDVAQKLGESGVNIIVDTGASDASTPSDIDAQGFLLRDVISTMEKLFGRDAFIIDDIVILRDKRWYRKPLRDSALRPQNPGGLAIGGVNAPVREKTSEEDPVKATSLLRASKKITLSAENAPVDAILEEIRRQSGWKIKADTSLKKRTLTAFVQDVEVSRLVDALSRVLEADTEVTLGKSRERQEAESYLFNGGDDPMERLIAESERLLPDLLDSLSESQKQTLAEKGTLSLKLSELPPSLKDRCLKYLQDNIKQLNASGATINADTNRLDQSLVNIKDPSNRLRVGGSVFGTDGNLHTF